MSDYEESDDDYQYPSEEEEENEDEEWERKMSLKESHVILWLDADEEDFRLWSEGNTIRLSIYSSLRQIVKPSESKKKLLCSRDELFDDEEAEKVVRIFLDVMDGMVVVYTLSFNANVSMTRCPPVLKCISYCGRGTYLFPNQLLPNCFSQFIDFGKVFDQLSRELMKYRSSFSSFIMVNEDSIYYKVQELAYLTQYRTSYVFDLEESGIVTGLERDRVVKPGDGVGYSVGYSASDVTLKKDDSHQYKLTTLMNNLYTNFDERLRDSPLAEILSLMINELSVEEITRADQYAEAIFKLISILQRCSMENQTSVVQFDEVILHKLASFKDILMDEYGLQNVVIPEDIMAILRAKNRAGKKNCAKGKGKRKTMDIEKSTDTDAFTMIDPVLYIENLFTRHSYLSENTTTSKAILKRMKIEFNTLSTSLPPTIKYMVSEENMSLGKFLIVGPTDTPYQGGYFLFDLKLPNDYPATSPKVNFLTTGGGSVRFNPNLYNCGKVCLSLLGTWSGEKWNPEVSNINQVLQSICYLIFVEEPYFNEPGYTKNERSMVESQRYNEDKRRSTIKFAYLAHLTHPDKYFGDIIREMMIASWDETKVVFEKWAAEDTVHGKEMTDNIAKIEAQLSKAAKKAK